MNDVFPTVACDDTQMDNDVKLLDHCTGWNQFSPEYKYPSGKSEPVCERGYQKRGQWVCVWYDGFQQGGDLGCFGTLACLNM